MRELLYTILELEEWNRGGTCDFCSRFENSENQSICQIRTRSKMTEELIANDCVCQECKEKFENNELPKCKRCKRLETKLNRDTLCDCIRNNEDAEEKELPILPHEGRPYAFYERQINTLRGKLTTAEETIEVEREVHEDFMRVSEEWGKRQKQELLDRIKELEAEVERLKKLTDQELVNKLTAKEKEVSELKTQLEKLTSQQQTAQIEVKETKKWPWRLKK